jgi:hypothetical protein
VPQLSAHPLARKLKGNCMSKWQLILVILIIGVFFGCSAGKSTKEYPKRDEIIVTDIAVKPLDTYTSEHEMWISGKATVKNNSSDERWIIVTIQGVDIEGFGLKDFDLKGFFLPNEVKTISNTSFILEKNLDKIIKWQVQEITIRH